MRDTHIQDCEAFQAVLPEVILGSLGADEAHVVLEHVVTCAECHDALRQNAGLVSQALLSDINLQVDVPATIKQGLMDQIKGAPQLKPGFLMDQSGTVIVRPSEVPWQETGIPGMQWRPLSCSRYDARTMSMFRMEAGCTFPEHRHEGVEELYMLRGMLLVEGVTMHPGDYCHAEFGSMHSPVVAVTNAEFLVSMGTNTFVSH